MTSTVKDHAAWRISSGLLVFVILSLLIQQNSALDRILERTASLFSHEFKALLDLVVSVLFRWGVR